MNDNYSQAIKKPAKLMLIYLLLSLFFFLYSVYKPVLNNRPLFIVYVLICDIFAYWGFRFGAERVGMASPYAPRSFDIMRFMRILFWIALVLGIIKYMLYTGDHTFSINSKIQNLIKGVYSFKDSYNDRHSVVAVSGFWKILNYGTVVLGPLHWVYMPLSIYYWKKLPVYQKIGSAFILFVYVFQYLSCGASVGIVYFAIFFLAVMFIKNQVDSDRIARRKLNKERRKKNRKFIILVVVIAILGFYVFGGIMADRRGGYEPTVISVGNQRWELNKDSLICRIVPEAYHSSLAAVYSYLLRPYAALDMALSIADEVEVPLCFGAGGSWFLADNVKSIFGYDVMQQTYNMRLDEHFGYNYYTQWHTVYVWLANDFTFLLVPVVLFLLMMIFGAAWRDFLSTQNIFALILMVLFCEFVFFMPMNNQVFQHSDTLFAFWGGLIIWIQTRRKYCYK